MTNGIRLLNSLFVSSRPTLEQVLSYSPREITIGLELEYLIQINGLPVKSEDFETLVLSFSKNFKKTEKFKIDNVLHVRAYIDEVNFVECKPDFSFNVFELAFSPVTYPDLESFLTPVLSAFEKAAAESNIKILRRSVARDLHFEQIEMAPWSRLNGYLDQFEKQKKPVGSSWYPSQIASTQVHLGIFSAQYFQTAANLFIQEFIFAKKFTFTDNEHISTPTFQLSRHHHYEEALGKNYILKTIPEKIYTSTREFQEFADSCPLYFNKDPISPVRDLAHIRPRPMGTIEFRSTCSTSNIQTILEIVMSRMAQTVVAYGVLSLENKDVLRSALLSKTLWLDTLGIKTKDQNALETKYKIENLHERTLLRIKEALGPSLSSTSLKRVAA